jgi:dienelactone hydrolase
MVAFFGAMFLVSVLAFDATPASVIRTYNHLTYTSDGVPISFDVFEPANSHSNYKAAVIVGHGVIVNKEMMRLIALELAGNGIVAVAFDFRGHGQSGGELPASSTLFPGRNSTSSQTSSSLALDILAVKGYLASRGDINMTNLGYVGYSMGGGAGFELLSHDGDFNAMVGLAPVPDYNLVNTTTPRNLLLLVGGLDEAIPRNDLLTVMAHKTGLPASSVELDHTYGSFASGTAARMVVDPLVDHFFAPYDPTFIREIVNWNLQALRVGSPAASGSDYPVLIAELLFATGGALGFFWSVSGLVLAHFARQKSKAPVSERILEGISRRYLVGRYLAYGLVLSAPSMSAGALLLLLPLTVSGLFFMLLAGTSVATLLMVWRTYARKGVGFVEMYRSCIATTSWRNVLVGTSLGVFLYALLELSAGNILGIVPSFFRWEWLPVYFVAVFLALLNLLFFALPLVAEKFGRKRKNGALTAGAVSTTLNLAILGTLLLVVCLALRSFFFMMIIFPYIPLACVLFFTGTYYYLRTNDLVMPAVTVTISWAIIIVTLSPYYA